jgi:hypothetical protein
MDIIEQRVGGWLDGRKPPTGYTDQQRQNLRADIIAVVKAKAPPVGVDQWLGQVLERVILQARSGVWPGPQVWAMAVGGVAKAKADEAAGAVQPSAGRRAVEAFAAAINAGRPVGEMGLFSHKVAGRALADGLVTFHDVRRYQRGAFLSRADFYGEAEALAWADRVDAKFGQEMRARAQGRAQAEIRMPYADEAEVVE